MTPMFPFFRKKLSWATKGLTQQHILAVVIIAAIVAITVLASSSGKPEAGPAMRREAFDPQVLAVQEGGIPHAFPADLPLEKNDPDFRLTQSNSSLDYLRNTASYLVVFTLPADAASIAENYEAYLNERGYDFSRQAFEEGATVAFNGTRDGTAIAVNITELRVVPPEDAAPELIEQLHTYSPPRTYVSISFAR